jgi:hypothetical protein
MTMKLMAATTKSSHSLRRRQRQRQERPLMINVSHGSFRRTSFPSRAIVLLLWLNVGVFISAFPTITTTNLSRTRISTIAPTRRNSLGHHNICSEPRKRPTVLLAAKRNRKQGGSKSDDDDLYRWYDDVDENASPDDVFWSEMERQRLLNQLGEGESSNENGGGRGDYPMMINPIDALSSMVGGGGGGGGYSDTAAAAAAAASSMSSLSSSQPMPIPMPMSNIGGGGGGGGGGGAVWASNSAASSTLGTGMSGTGSGVGGGLSARTMWNMPKPTVEQQKSAEATLAEYTLYMVSDNWLDDDLIEAMNALPFEPEGDLTLEEETRILEEQLEAMEDGEGGGGAVNGGQLFWTENEEPWDYWGETPQDPYKSDVMSLHTNKGILRVCCAGSVMGNKNECQDTMAPTILASLFRGFSFVVSFLIVPPALLWCFHSHPPLPIFH